jgi:hypothetical protein
MIVRLQIGFIHVKARADSASAAGGQTSIIVQGASRQTRVHEPLARAQRKLSMSALHVSERPKS